MAQIELRYHEVCKRADAAAQAASFFYLEGGEAALAEDLIHHFKRAFRGSKDIRPDNVVTVESPGELMREMDAPAIEIGDAYKIVLARDAHKLFTSRTTEQIVARFDRDRLDPRLRVIMHGARLSDEMIEYLGRHRAYGLVGEPSHEKLGAWLASRTLDRANYYRMVGTPLISPEDGERLMEQVGWSWVGALQAVRTIRSMTTEPISWPHISALVPRNVGAGYSDALVFGKGRSGALRLAEGVMESEVLRTLGLARYHLRKLAVLRAHDVERMGDRAAALAGRVHIWQYRTRYKPVYARYDNEKLRLRFEAVDQAFATARSGVTQGVLEVLAVRW